MAAIDPTAYLVEEPPPPNLDEASVDLGPPPWTPPSDDAATPKRTPHNGTRWQNTSAPKILSNHERLLPRAEAAARQLIRSWCDYGPKQVNECDPDTLPGILSEIGRRVLHATLNKDATGFEGVYVHFTDAPDGILDEFVECNQGNSPRPQDCGPLLEIIREFHQARQRDILAHRLRDTLERADDPITILREIAELESAGTRRTRSMIVNGVNSYPTIVPAETVILGKNWLRRGDFATFISGAGGGKSVGATQAAMAWGLGLPYFGIRPPRPIRILLFSGEDDGVTIGQCREGFLEHSMAITGRQLTASDLAPLDDVIRTEFIREHVGEKFHVHLAALLRESPADLVVVNPLLSYIGGEIVAKASEWMRAGLMPVLQEHNCAALVVHHTPKLSKDSWDSIDDTYSGIGGGEIANAPRAVLTLRPTPVDDLCVLTVSKRKTTGWKTRDGKFVASYFVRRSGNPERPAWLPVDHDEAEEMIAASRVTRGERGGREKKVSTDHVVAAVTTGAMQRQALIDWLMRKCACSKRTATDAIRVAEMERDIVNYSEHNPRGGIPLKWLCLPEHLPQDAK